MFDWFKHLFNQIQSLLINGSSHQRCSLKTDVLTNSAKFTVKQLCQSLVLNTVAGLQLHLERDSGPETQHLPTTA